MRGALIARSLAGCALVAVAAGVSLERGWLRLNHPDPSRFPVWGVDVSHHQGRVDWAAVAAEPHLAFAYLKATEGGDFTDPRFLDNWRQARAAGLEVGAYHFFTFCRPALDQAAHFLSVLPAGAGALPPAVDLELGGNCALTADSATVRAELALWLQRVAEGTGRRPIVYATREAYQAFLAGRGLRYPIWIRDIWTEPRLPDRAWTFWQFANRARVAGSATFVDLNLFAGGRADLGRL